MVASKLKIPVLYIEAVLCSFNRRQPEEQIRVLTDHLGELCFAPVPIQPLAICGGETFLQGTPCVTVWRETEWVELIDGGWNQLADPADHAAILTAMAQQLELDASQPRPPPYGDGHAAEAIVRRLN